MDKSFWLERWQQNQIGFHEDGVNTHLQAFWKQLGLDAPGRVFVPLCGKSRDLLWLRAQGHQVFGVELSPIAVEAFFSENALDPIRTEGESAIDLSFDEIVLRNGDFFDLTAADLEGVTGVYDRASLIALPKTMRRRYAARMKSIVSADVPVLLITLEYDPESMKGPPFSVAETEVRDLYSDTYEIRLIHEEDVLAENAKFREQGLTSLLEKVYLLSPLAANDEEVVPITVNKNDFHPELDVKISAREELYKGFLGVVRYRLRHRLHEGGWSTDLIRERIEGLEAASVLLYDPRQDAVVLIEQFRIGAMDGRSWVIETVGGYVPPRELPEDVARREVKEETGCEVGRLEPIASFWVSPGYSSERIHLFCGEVDSTKAGGVHGLPEEGEDILVKVVPAEEAIAAIDKGTGDGWADSTSLVMALHWLALNRERLRQEWKLPYSPNS